jgi:hypothetical protein
VRETENLTIIMYASGPVRESAIFLANSTVFNHRLFKRINVINRKDYLLGASLYVSHVQVSYFNPLNPELNPIC